MKTTGFARAPLRNDSLTQSSPRFYFLLSVWLSYYGSLTGTDLTSHMCHMRHVRHTRGMLAYVPVTIRDGKPLEQYAALGDATGSRRQRSSQPANCLAHLARHGIPARRVEVAQRGRPGNPND